MLLQIPSRTPGTMRSGRVPVIHGEIIAVDVRGIQTVKTDCRDHPIIKCIGPNQIRGGHKGDRVRLTYRFNPALGALWYGKKL